jgi:ammonia channel protein AmtB
VQGAELKVLTGCILGAFIIIAWVSITTPIMFFAIKSIGWLRVSPEVEDRGLDEV